MNWSIITFFELTNACGNIEYRYWTLSPALIFVIIQQMTNCELQNKIHKLCHDMLYENNIQTYF